MAESSGRRNDEVLYPQALDYSLYLIKAVPVAFAALLRV